jgi:hypothetical protein
MALMTPRARRSIFVLVVATVTVAGALAGCMREDQGQGMTIWNRTSATVEVNYRRIVGTVEMADLVMEIPSNQRVIVVSLHQAEGECIRGTLLAIQDGRTIAALSQPCQGAQWVITDPEGSPSSLSPP